MVIVLGTPLLTFTKPSSSTTIPWGSLNWPKEVTNSPLVFNTDTHLFSLSHIESGADPGGWGGDGVMWLQCLSCTCKQLQKSNWMDELNMLNLHFENSIFNFCRQVATDALALGPVHTNTEYEILKTVCVRKHEIWKAWNMENRSIFNFSLPM